jgi:hypothetical protein
MLPPAAGVAFPEPDEAFVIFVTPLAGVPGASPMPSLAAGIVAAQSSIAARIFLDGTTGRSPAAERRARCQRIPVRAA